MKKSTQPRKNILTALLRFFGWTFGFTGFYAMTMNCPCCGQIGCPVGTAGAGILGMMVGLIVQRRPLFSRKQAHEHPQDCEESHIHE